MRFGVLGPLSVWADDGTPVPVPGAKVRAVLADLLVHGGRPVPADRLIDDLWGDDLPGNPPAALSAKVSQLRRVLEDAEPGGRELVPSGPSGYRLTAESVDARRFEQLIGEARRATDPQVRAGLHADALGLWRGPAYADLADEAFTRPTITRLTELRLTAEEDRAEARLELGEHSVVAGEVGDLLTEHPFRERLRAAHLKALYGAGRQSEALDSYQELRHRMADELGLDPSPELVRLHQAILGQDPQLGIVRRPARRANLPAPRTELIGRDDAVAAIRAELGTSRLVTLTGPGGVGKTRLALAAANGLVSNFPDGVELVELAGFEPAAAVDDLAELVLARLGVHAADDRPAAELVADAVAPRRLLLVLDNCEHVIEAAAGLAELLLDAAADVRILATGREPLALAGELLWNVPPLDLPDPAGDPASSAAVRLFVARASAADRSFRLDQDTAGPVAELCRRLDGIPLALELAATRTRALGVAGLLERLDDRFRALGSGPRDAPARQQTLTAVIDWSWHLLNPDEQLALRRLAVHADGCTPDAAEAVGGHGLDVLSRLVDRSLVAVVPGADGPRYRLLESVAAYGVDRLREAGELDQVQRAHASYYLRLAEQAAPHLRGPEQRRWLLRLDAETANLRTAFDHLVSWHETEQVLRLASALSWHRILRGRLTEAHRALTTALAPTVSDSSVSGATTTSDAAMTASRTSAVSDGSVTGTARTSDSTAAHGDATGMAAVVAEAAVWRAYVATWIGEIGETAARREEVLALWAMVDDPRGRARAEWLLADSAAEAGELGPATELLERALDGAIAGRDRWLEAAVLAVRAKLAHVRGDLAGLEADAGRSAGLFRELGDRWGVLQATEWQAAVADLTGDGRRAARMHRDGLRIAEDLGLWAEASGRLSWLGWNALQAGDYAQAQVFAERGLRLAEEHGSRSGQVFARMGLGFAARRNGRLDVAETQLEWLLDQARAEGTEVLYLGNVLNELGFLAEQRGDATTAAKLQQESHDVAQHQQASRDVAVALVGLAGAAVLAGDPAEAARLLGRADALHAGVGAERAPAELFDLDRVTAATRSALTESAFTSSYDAGMAFIGQE